MPDRPRNIGASVRQRLLNLAHARGQSMDLLLTRYALERLLHRLSLSPHRERFVLKGAMLLAIWFDEPHRATRDVDLLGFGDAAEDALLVVTARESAAGLIGRSGAERTALPDALQGRVVHPQQFEVAVAGGARAVGEARPDGRGHGHHRAHPVFASWPAVGPGSGGGKQAGCRRRYRRELAHANLRIVSSRSA